MTSAVAAIIAASAAACVATNYGTNPELLPPIPPVASVVAANACSLRLADLSGTIRLGERQHTQRIGATMVRYTFSRDGSMGLIYEEAPVPGSTEAKAYVTTRCSPPGGSGPNERLSMILDPRKATTVVGVEKQIKGQPWVVESVTRRPTEEY